MSSQISLQPLIWAWYVGFYLSMGMVLAVWVAFAFAILLIHWLYLCARRVESEPTPSSFPTAMLRLTGFQALVAGAVLVPIGTIALFYLLSDLVWKLAPNMVNAPPVPSATVSTPTPDSGSVPVDDWFSGMASLVIYLGAFAALVAGTIFLFLRSYARKIDQETGPIGLIKRIVRRYFHESILVGFLLVLITWPVILYFFYNLAWLVMYMVPSTAQELPRIAFPGAERFYTRSVEVIGSWLIVVLFVPAAWLLLRALRLKWRYTIENPTMNLIFQRSIKWSLLVFLGGVGGTVMGYLAHSTFRFIVQAVFR